MKTDWVKIGKCDNVGVVPQIDRFLINRKRGKDLLVVKSSLEQHNRCSKPRTGNESNTRRKKNTTRDQSRLEVLTLLPIKFFTLLRSFCQLGNFLQQSFPLSLLRHLVFTRENAQLKTNEEGKKGRGHLLLLLKYKN